MNSDASQWEKIFQSGGYRIPEPRPLVVRFTENLKVHGLVNVLDLGCGRGRHVIYMAQDPGGCQGIVNVRNRNDPAV